MNRNNALFDSRKNVLQNKEHRAQCTNYSRWPVKSNLPKQNNSWKKWPAYGIRQCGRWLTHPKTNQGRSCWKSCQTGSWISIFSLKPYADTRFDFPQLDRLGLPQASFKSWKLLNHRFVSKCCFRNTIKRNNFKTCLTSSNSPKKKQWRKQKTTIKAQKRETYVNSYSKGDWCQKNHTEGNTQNVVKMGQTEAFSSHKLLLKL